MAIFKCGTCHAVYVDYYPPDDSCLKCHRGPLGLSPQPDHFEEAIALARSTSSSVLSNPTKEMSDGSESDY